VKDGKSMDGQILFSFGGPFRYPAAMNRLKNPRSWFHSFVIACSLLVSVSVSRAALIAYEPFDYEANVPIVGQTNGFGFTSAWVPGGFNARLFDLFHINSGALTFPGLATKGTNHAGGEAPPPGTPGIAGVGRILATNLAVPGATCYLSFLHQVDADQEYASIVLGTGGGMAKELSIGKSASPPRYNIAQRGGVGRVFSNVQPAAGATVFLVVKMEFRNGPDRFTLFVNPTPGKPEPVSTAVKEDLDIEEAEMIYLYSRGTWSVDEIRLGTTWADVTPAQKTAPTQ
jgi:hypothetical protein